MDNFSPNTNLQTDFISSACTRSVSTEAICQKHQEASCRALVPCALRRILSSWVKAPELFPSRRHRAACSFYFTTCWYGARWWNEACGCLSVNPCFPSPFTEEPKALAFPLSAVRCCGLTLTSDRSHFFGSECFKLCHKVWVRPFEMLIITGGTRAANACSHRLLVNL